MGILDKLRGGDLRSIGRADEVVENILAKPPLFDDVFKGLYTSACVRMRSADVIEKVTRRHPEYLEKWRDTITQRSPLFATHLFFNLARYSGISIMGGRSWPLIRVI